MYKGNIGRYFTKTYFENFKPLNDANGYGLEFKGLKDHFQLLKNKVFISNFEIPEPLATANNQFNLTTVYPGLLIGSGYAHDVKGDEDALKLGFFFDHTTGLPCIPGSSIKGVLRAAAEKANGHFIEYILTEISEGNRKLKDSEPLALAKVYLNEKKGNLLGGKKSKFVKSIFDGESLPISQRNIFFDAFPVASGNEDDRFLDNDYITHHEYPLKNPNPLQFLKVLPNVAFRFEFLLKNTEMPGPLILELFRQILLDIGIGAKTNVGYGQFTDKEVVTKNIGTNDNNSTRTGDQLYSSVNKMKIKEEIPNKAKEHLKRNAQFNGRITRINGNLVQISFVVKEETCVIYKQLEKLKNINSKQVMLNTVVTIKIMHDYAYPDNLVCQVFID